MPPLQSRPGSYYATKLDTDYDRLMEKARSGEFEVIEAVDETQEKTYLFSPSNSGDDSDLVPHAMMEGVLLGMVVGNRIMSDGKDIRKLN